MRLIFVRDCPEIDDCLGELVITTAAGTMIYPLSELELRHLARTAVVRALLPNPDPGNVRSNPT